MYIWFGCIIFSFLVCSVLVCIFVFFVCVSLGHFGFVFSKLLSSGLVFFSTEPSKLSLDWLGRTSPKWPIWCRAGRKTLLGSVQLVASCDDTTRRMYTTEWRRSPDCPLGDYSVASCCLQRQLPSRRRHDYLISFPGHMSFRCACVRLRVRVWPGLLVDGCWAWFIRIIHPQ